MAAMAAISSSEFRCFDSSCPALSCATNKLSGLLRHVRDRHLPTEVLPWFIRQWGLHECPSCKGFFKELSKHTRCRGEDRVFPRQEPAISSSQSPKTVHVDLAIPARASSLSNEMASGASASSTARNIREQSESYDAPTAERRAWSLVEGLTWEEVFQRCPSTVVNVKDYLKSLSQQALRIPLQCLAVNASDVGAWKLLFLMPSMLLTRDVRRGGKKGSAEIKKKFRMFLDFSWQPLLKNPATPSYFNSGESEERGRLRKGERDMFTRELFLEQHVC